ncbi:MAG: sugar phosphate isomerase/epimerase [Verrucomicrobia bacterium]|nr:MAG: sugar phosphate isomerase/epimerase [Verrucomicrobiota bacterium]
MVREIIDLGFGRIELSHGIRLTLVAGILRAVEEGLVEISSVHNFCPLPPGVVGAAPNLYEPSDPQLSEVRQWYRNTCRTIEFAHQVGAKIMVSHLGSVRFPLLNPVTRARRRMEKGKLPANDIAAMIRLWQHVLSKVQKRAPAFWGRVKTNIEPVAEVARRHGVRVGCENREGMEELPLDASIGELFADQDESGPLRYWHDVGHAQLKQQMGVADHEAMLEANRRWLTGFHLHDVRDGRDHSVPGTGTIDFSMVRRFIGPDHTLVLELSPRLSVEEVLESKGYMEKLLAG